MPTAGSDGYVYLNGEILSAAEARVPVLDRGFLWGDGVYEITPCFHGRPFRLEQHLERLFVSARIVGIPIDLSTDELSSKTLQVVELNRDVTAAHPVCRVGHWITRGVEEWVPLEQRARAATVCILVQPAGGVPSPQEYRSGVHLSIVSTRRTPSSAIDPRLKTTSRMNQIIAELEGSAMGALALMLDVDDHIAEGPTFNFFLARDGELVTPRAERVLPGVTRRAVLELATELGVPTLEADLAPYDLATASELFVTASTWGVLPVRSVDRFRPGDEVPGKLTSSLIDRLAALTGYHPLERTG